MVTLYLLKMFYELLYSVVKYRYYIMCLAVIPFVILRNSYIIQREIPNCFYKTVLNSLSSTTHVKKRKKNTF